LILFVLALAIALPAAGFIRASVICGRLSRENQNLVQQNLILQSELASRGEQKGNLAAETSSSGGSAAPDTLLQTVGDTGIPNEPSFSYQALYPDLYCQPPKEQKRPEKTVFLTFDDGPTQYTERILAVLDKYGVKATFFVVGKDTEEGRALLRKTVQAGHAVAIHTYSHVYTKIYASVDNYLDDFYKIYRLILDTTGTTPTVFRFPGGSINNYNRAVYQQIIAEMTRRGFTYYDWNVSASDTDSNSSPKKIEANIVGTFERFACPIVLMHDGYEDTYQALDNVIAGIRDKGYSFGVLTNEISPVVFSYRD
jgi:peptidoglycan/xylan/chitin deacetylase (PgdA/CDA1 family)